MHLNCLNSLKGLNGFNSNGCHGLYGLNSLHGLHGLNSLQWFKRASLKVHKGVLPKYLLNKEISTFEIFSL